MVPLNKSFKECNQMDSHSKFKLWVKPQFQINLQLPFFLRLYFAVDIISNINQKLLIYNLLFLFLAFGFVSNYLFNYSRPGWRIFLNCGWIIIFLLSLCVWVLNHWLNVKKCHFVRIAFHFCFILIVKFILIIINLNYPIYFYN